MAALPGKLNHIGAKIARSMEHYHALDREIAAFLDTKPYVIRHEFDPEQRTYSYFAKPLQEVPLQIRVLTGEVLGQLRSALDHLAWQLALVQTPNPQGSTEFPIGTGKDWYRSNRARKIGDLPKVAKAIIDGLQPHLDKTPEDNLLWKLHRLTNDDKHRLPHVAFGAPGQIWLGKPLPGARQEMGVGFSDEARRGRDFSISVIIGPFEQEKKIGEIGFKNPSETDLEVEDVTITIDLAFSTKARPRACRYAANCSPTAKESKRLSGNLASSSDSTTVVLKDDYMSSRAPERGSERPRQGAEVHICLDVALRA